MKYMELGLKRLATLPFIIFEKMLMVIGEVVIFFRPALIPPIIQVILVDNWGFIVMVMTEVEIGLRPSNCLHILLVEYKL